MSEGFTHFHWAFVIAAYAVTAFGLAGLTGFICLKLRAWEKRAREEAAE
jgi:hypothetical protein